MGNVLNLSGIALTSTQGRWRALAHKLVTNALLPGAEQIDREAQFPAKNLSLIADAGLSGLILPKEVGGAGENLMTCALVVEAHAGHGEAGRRRSVRPVGSSLQLRWPEFGYGLVPANDEWPCREVVVKGWRGPRDERDWPKRLTWGEPWPWVTA